MKEYKYIFFDFDGTLVDTIKGTGESALYALKHFNIQVENEDEIGRIFCGPPLKQTFKKYGLNDDEIKKAIELFRYFQYNNTIESYETYDGIIEVLQYLKNKNKTLIIVTGKLEEVAIKILKNLNIYDYFDIVVGAKADNSRVTKNEIMDFAITQIENVDFNKSIIIGDSASDIKAGIANNMDSIGVLYGANKREVLEEAGATYFVEKPLEISDIIKN